MKIEVLNAIDGERAYQEIKWPNRIHSVAEWILILDKLVRDATAAWVTKDGDIASLEEIRKIAATACACMEQCGAIERTIKTK